MNFQFDTTYLKYILLVLLVFFASTVLVKIIRRLMGRFFREASNILKVDPTNYNFFKNAVSLIIYLSGLIVIFSLIPKLKALGVTLFASAGIFAAIVGFASQAAFSNIISGIFIVIFKPFRVGDVIKIGIDVLGEIEDITLRHTVIRNFENRRIIIPNSKISSETILNSSIVEAKICNFFDIGISYDSDIDRTINIIREEATNHPNFIDNRSDKDKEDGIPAIIVRIIDFTDSAILIRANIWSETSAKGHALKCDLRYTLKKRFDNEGIEIPFRYVTVINKSEKQKTDKSEITQSM